MTKKLLILGAFLATSMTSSIMAEDEASTREAQRVEVAKKFQAKNTDTFSVFVKGFC